jgi:hypothetical protein
LPTARVRAKIDVVSPGAAAVRVALALHEAAAGMTLRFTGNGERAEPLGPVSAADVAGRYPRASACRGRRCSDG